jgi:hypothetical protein
MVDRGHVFRRAFSWLPSQFASQSDSPVGAPRQFGSTEHLSTEAIAAFVDNELRMSAHLRAAHHISLCPECAAEVDGQRRARAALRDSRPIRIPNKLLGELSQIPHCRPDDDAGPGRGPWGSARTRGRRTPPDGGPNTHSPGPVRPTGPFDRPADGSPPDRHEPR